MNVLLFTVLLTLQAPSPAPVDVSASKWEGASHVAIAALNVAQFADLSTTMYMSGKGGFREANPLLRPFFDKPVRMALVKGGIATAISYGLFRLHKKHPKIVTFVSVGLAGVTGYVAWHNSRLERGK